MTDHTVTVVSAYYKIPSKTTHENYMNWITNFFKIPFNLVFFSHGDELTQIKKLTDRKNVYFIDKSFHSLFYQSTDYRKIWKKHKRYDREDYHTQELYCIWHQKTKFVLESILYNPFNSDKFLWVDAGCFRENIDPFMNFPNYNLIPKDKMLFLSIEKFIEDDYKTRDFKYCNRLGGGIYGSSIDVWVKWDKIYTDTLQYFIDKKIFAGKDQHIINTIYLDHPELFEIYYPPIHTTYDKWFYLHVYLK